MRPVELPWLPEPAADFRQQVRTLDEYPPADPTLARRLATSRLGVTQLHTLGTALLKLTESDPDVTRLGVLANGTVDFLHSAITVSALRHGIWLRTVKTPFDQVAAQAFDPSSRINQARCHFILLCIDHRGLPVTATAADLEGARTAVDAALRYFDSICAALKAAAACTLIVQTLPQIPTSIFGSLERTVPGTLPWLIDQYNHELRLRVGKSSDLLLDVAALAETVGLSEWHDPVQWTLGKFPFAQSIVPLYADWVGRLIAAARGRSRKCLVLDLDNTIWGGVIGDDGLAGIVLGNGSPAGEAYLNIQQTALSLRERGIILAVSSKNDDQVARSPFRSHPEMLLREEHISVFQANWQDKASNLKAIAKALNIGVDALVLLDDNPFERAQVRAALPDVSIPELPADPSYYSQTLLSAGYFESTGFTGDDRDRAARYQENSARAELLGTATDVESYLRSLAMRATCGPFDHVGRGRITQLINKTNQFNLTTRRYTESEVKGFEDSSAAFTLQVRLLDRFGDNGMISVVICIVDGPDWSIDTWLMSCRVLNRNVEKAVLNHIVAKAGAAGARTLIGEYIRTERNALVSDHYARLGFSSSGSGDGRSLWHLDVASYIPAEVPIELVTRIDSRQ